MNKKLLLVVAILVVGIAAAVSFAVTANSATVSLDIGGGGASAFMAITGAAANDGRGQYEPAPSWSPIEDTAGGIDTKGDLYYIEPYTSTDIVEGMAFVYLTNVGALAGCYSYLNMGLTLWYTGTNTAGIYTTTTQTDTPDEWLTLTNGYVSFDLEITDVVTYAITLNEVSWYCTDGTCNGGGGDLSPAFYVHVIQK